MQIIAIQTRALIPPKDDLLEVFDTSLPVLKEKSVVVVSSKVVAIWQGRCEPIPGGPLEDIRVQKQQLARREADVYMNPDDTFPYSRLFTVYEGIFGSISGIDASNGNDYFVLLPKNTQQIAKDLRDHLKEKYFVRDLGVVITDSRSMPMRQGTTAVALGYAGIVPMFDYRGKEDIFGRKLAVERMNVVDSLATAANLVMGEGDECTPLAVCTGVPHVVFGSEQSDDPMLNPKISMQDDLFAQFLSPHPWKCGKKTADHE